VRAADGLGRACVKSASAGSAGGSQSDFTLVVVLDAAD
jgi:hypothetical protein